MKTLHIIVSDKVASYLQRDGYIVCGNSDYQVEFTFSSEWDAYTKKTARFIWRGKPVDVEFSGNVCPVPIVANTEELKVGVYVENLSTTTSAVIPCRLSVLCDSKTEAEGTVVVPEGTPVLIEKTIIENGEYPAKNYGADGFSKVKIKVAGEAPKLYGEEVTPTKNYQNITPKAGYDGLDEVIVHPIPDKYIEVETCTMQYISGNVLGIIYSDGTETKRWANEPDGTIITVACNTPIVFYYPMGDEAPNVTITTAGGNTLQATQQFNYGAAVYTIPSEYKNTHLRIAW